jgi:thioester reductase-like protein
LVKQDLGDAVFSENDFFIGQHYYENVYVRSKFEAENIILSAMNDGLTATIYRVGMLSGRYSDGHFQANIQDNGLYNRMKSVILLRAIPEDLLKQELEYTPVDYCSRAIILLAKINENKNKIFHIFNDKMILVSQFIEASKLCGFDIQIQDAGSFNDYLKKIICDRENTWALTGIINDLNLTKTIGLQHSPEIASEITCQYLQQLGFKWPDIDLPYLIKVINYMESIGFLKKNFDTQEKDILA